VSQLAAKPLLIQLMLIGLAARELLASIELALAAQSLRESFG
jgi:hypothetical protein